MTRSILILLGIIALLWPGALRADVDVVTTTTDTAALTRAVGGEHVTVSSLTKGASDPHFAVAKPSMIRRVADADLLVLIGAELEIGWLPAVLQAARNGKVLAGAEGYLDLSRYITLLDVPSGAVSRARGDVHRLGNPHYWLDPRNGIIMAQAIAARLSQLDPDNARAYARNFQAFKARMEESIGEWADRLKDKRGTQVVTYHKSFLYLTGAFGLKEAGYLEPLPGVSPTASHLQDLVKRIERQNIRYLLMEPFYERRSARFLNEKTGIKAVILPQSVGSLPGIETYEALFEEIVSRLEKA